ncbi:membrane protein DedA, SNARE-associated domain [Paracoccus alkenifer]|uniref:Membrane protein DedA, SNARE-associated domain n=2 Tax=Paracoccus alkenifer TaxID=65735 RepID=A0A1H6LNG2_9RHOB|nr:membrane protein DedA, SNARE-associated domain [Paracoccus alkenifer]
MRPVLWHGARSRQGMGAMFDWVLSVIESWGYSGIFLLMVAEHLFPPIPSEVIMPLAGYLAASGKLSLLPTVIAGTLGSVVGTSAWFVIGWWIGAARLKRWAARHGRLMTLSPGDIDMAQAWFDRRGGAAVFLGRMIPAVRTLISVPAGIARMSLWRFFAFTVLGSLLWTLVLTLSGLVLQANFHLVEEVIDPLSKIVVVTVVLVYIYRVATWRPH